MIAGCHGDGLMNHLAEAVILHALYEMARNSGPGINSSLFTGAIAKML